MILGTAGFTAALALHRMEQNDQHPGLGPVVVTGATGGVGMLAIDILSRAGYEVHAISGKAEHADFLRGLGAREVLPRDALAEAKRPLEAARYGGAIDNVGDPMLAALLRVVAPYGNVASCGLAGGPDVATTVMPFIIRGVSLLGIASAGTARPVRDAVWQKLATTWKPAHLDRICTRTATLAQLPAIFPGMLAGGSFGRTLVDL
jgi:acrylyl-CoA reductase (NADPH)